jgi:hypothetical protein
LCQYVTRLDRLKHHHHTPDLNVIFAPHDGGAAAVAVSVQQKGLTEDHGTCQ